MASETGGQIELPAWRCERVDGALIEYVEAGRQEGASYWAPAPNRLFAGAIDGVHVCLSPYRGVSKGRPHDWLVNGDASAPTRERPTVARMVERFPTYEAARAAALAWISEAREALVRAVALDDLAFAAPRLTRRVAADLAESR